MIPFKRVLIILLSLVLIQVDAYSESTHSNQVYPIQNAPFGHGIFQNMHWRQLKNRPNANINNPNLAGAAFHIPWAALEPSKGVLDTTILDNLLSIWGDKGKKIILHIKISPGGHKETNPWKESSTPKWLYEAGAQFVVSTKNEARQLFPVLWDATFLTEYQRFLNDLAKRYDGHPSIEFIIVGPGAFASTRAIYPQMINKLRAAGYTDKKWFETLEKIITINKASFTKTPLALGVAPFVKPNYIEDPQYNHLTIAQLAAEKGLYLYSHNLKGTDKWLKSPYPHFFAAIGTKTKIVLGLDNPSSGSAKSRAKHGDPLSTFHHAFGGVRGLPIINTHYIVLYERDVAAATPGNKKYQQEYEDSMQWALDKIKNKL